MIRWYSPSLPSGFSLHMRACGMIMTFQYTCKMHGFIRDCDRVG